MCGICGLVEFENKQPIPREIVHRMNETLRHRGPDDEGIFVGPGIGLGHRRLSIIDLVCGHQPIANEDSTVWVLLNGEIYNYTELRQELIRQGHHFASRSDTEVIVHLYEEHGEGCVARLRGMFSFALWDARERKLLLARDRIGKKPLFYFAGSRGIVFGSELKALLATDYVPREVDNQALCDYFSFGYIPAPKTIYRSVRKVRPGHYLVASARGIQEVEYWDLSFARIEHRSEDEWCGLLRQQLCEATRIRLMSDVPLGAFLSGGVDSSSVVAMMSRIMNRPVTTCSIAFEEQGYNEGEYARQVAHQFKTDHHEQIVRPNATEIVDKLAWHYDEPFADSSAIPTYHVSSVARQHVTVALGGDGGDENFAGYRRYAFDYLENRLRGLCPSRMRRAVFGPLGKWYPALAWAPRIFRAKATFQSLSASPLEGYFNSIAVLRPHEKRRIFTADFRKALGDYNSLEVLRDHYDRADTDDPLSRIQYVDIKTYLTDDILAKVDRASMAVSLEVRAPLLDHKLMEMAASIPSSLKLRGGMGKHIFKKALAPLLPPETLHRKKQGFAIPLDQWFRRELRELAQDAIFSAPDGILDAAFLRKLWQQHQRGTHNRAGILWAVLMLRKWEQAFGQRRPA